MKKSKRLIPAVVMCLAIFNAMLFFSMRHFWSGVYALTGIHSLPVILMAVLVVIAVLSVYLRKIGPAVAVLAVVTVLFFAALCYMFSQAFPGWRFIVREFLLLALRMLAVAAVALLLYKLPGRPFLALKGLAIAALAVAVFCFSYGISFGGFAQGPAVFAVGSDYQIVFTTRADSHAWVECGGVTYYDAYNGSARSGMTHKIIVPMEALDKARAYTVNARTMILRGPYDAIQGKAYREHFSFRPVDDSDGLNYYAISDTHDFTGSAVKTASYYGDTLDFLVLAGDHASFLNDEQDLTRALEIAHGVTGGGLPVVYARGNHEVKGELAGQLDRYVGADEGRFYYTFRLGSVWGVVLDMGEDHADDWWEFYGTAHFEDYRNQQLAFLQNLDPATEYGASGVTTRLAVCHIPLTVTYKNDFAAETKRKMVEALDEMDISLLLSGHTHQLFWTTPETPDGTELTAAETGKSIGTVIGAGFPAVIVSRNSNEQSMARANDIGTGNVGLALETKNGESRLWYSNNKGVPITLRDPLTGGALDQPLTLSALPQW